MLVICSFDEALFSLLTYRSFKCAWYFYLIFIRHRLLCRLGSDISTNKLGFVRNLAGNAEKWVVLKAYTANSDAHLGISSSTQGPGQLRGGVRRITGCEEEPASRGSFVRTGDHILLQSSAPATDYVISLFESAEGRDMRLQHKDRVLSGYDSWQVELHGEPSLPSWYKRPYLSGRYLIIPPAHKALAPEVEGSYFPLSNSSSSSSGSAGASKTVSKMTSAGTTGGRSVHSGSNSGGSSTSGAGTMGPEYFAPLPPPPLNELSTETQHNILMRELLLALAGFEGEYIRVAAPATIPTPATTASDTTKSSTIHTSMQHNPAGPYMRPVHFVMDADAADKSILSQVGQLLPLCEAAVFLKDFARVHSRYEYGLVSHAFAAALTDQLSDFENIVIQLEELLVQNKLTLQKMVYFLQPSRVLLRCLEVLCRKIGDSTGGVLLDTLYQSIQEQGDVKAKELHVKLLDVASKPYFKMLQLWLFRGELHDIYGEFMVQENVSATRDSLLEDYNAQFWEEHYTLAKIEHSIPKIFLPFRNKILTAGKYLNVVRNNILVGSNSLGSSKTNISSTSYSYGGASSVAQGESGRREYNEKKRRREHRKILNIMDRLLEQYPLSFNLSTYTTNSGSNGSNGRNDYGRGHTTSGSFHKTAHINTTILQSVDAAHEFSSRALLRLLEEKYSLSQHLRSLRRFFLLEHGDFFVQFMDTAEDELRRDVAEVSVSRIQSLLTQALHTSTLHDDPYKDLLTCSLAPHNLIQHLHLIQSAGNSDTTTGSGIGSNSSLISSQGLKGVEALTLDYKAEWPLSIVLSRRAFTKYQLLNRLLFFSKHVELRVLATWSDFQDTKQLNVRGVMGPSYALRHRMLHFLQNFVYYMCLEVIGPRAHEMTVGLENASNMDDVIQLHNRFLDLCLKECLLASQNLLKILTKIMTTCLLFSDQMKRFSANIQYNSNLVASQTKAAPLEKLPSPSHASKYAVDTERESAAARNARARDRRNTETRRAQADYIAKEVNHDAYRRLLVKFSDTFDAQLFEFLDTLWKDSHRYHPQLSNLCVRLDYNGFYSGRINSINGNNISSNSSNNNSTKATNASSSDSHMLNASNISFTGSVL